MSTFMCQKSFHPASQANQKKRFIAEQKEERRLAEEARRRKQLEEEQRLLQYSGDRTSEVSFMYRPPPGYMAVSGSKEKEKEKEPEEEDQFKNAPTEGAYTSGMEVSHKPFGKTYRNVKCIRCGNRGHQTGDRECPMLHNNPNENFNKEIEDPLQVMSQASTSDKKQKGVLLRQELTERHHGPANLRGKYDLVDSDDEGEVDAEALVSSLDEKQRKRLLKYIKKQKKKEAKKAHKKDKKRLKALRKLANKGDVSPQQERWVEAPQSHNERPSRSHRSDSDSGHRHSRSSRRSRDY